MSHDHRLWTPQGILAPSRIGGIDAERVHRLGASAEDLFLAVELANLARTPNLDDAATPERTTAVVRILLSLLTLVREGNTCLPLPPHTAFERTLSELGAPAPELRECRWIIEQMQDPAYRGSLRALFGMGQDYRPLILHDGALHLHSLLSLERSVARRLAGLLQTPSPATFDLETVQAALDNLQESPYLTPGGVSVKLSEEQLEAVKATTQSQLHCITGGPGTGKTSIVVSILRLFQRLHLGEEIPIEVALAAPTGKAADRLGNSIARALRALPTPAEADLQLQREPPSSQTLHRLLGANPRRRHFRYHQHFPLPHSLVILDEASMVDLQLFERLLAALRPGSTLILLGDADQLPSVDPGSVFRDLVATASNFHHVTSLTRSYRQSQSESEGSDLLSVAKAIRQDQGFEGVLVGRRAQAADLEFRGYERVLPLRPNDLDLFLEEWYRRVVRPAEFENLFARTYTTEQAGWSDQDKDHLLRLFDHEESYRLLVPTHGAQHGRGTVGLNRWFRRRLSPRSETRYLRVGEPVLMTRNDSTRQIYNGDLGLVLRVRSRVDDQGKPTAVFRVQGNFVAFELASIQESLVPAWALTVHKAQGSEYDRVALILPAEANRAVRRELVYTAVTRARSAVVVVASDDALRAAVARRSDRFSGLQAELEANLGANSQSPSDSGSTTSDSLSPQSVTALPSVPRPSSTKPNATETAGSNPEEDEPPSEPDGRQLTLF
ncbi:MAG: exodeoxyribonuclease V subunit alpha [Thermoanaerobaculia bacterium]|nr:exodeoxyribonuclease V subunit alpha [Thermoanaerobaculia bacterium]